MYYAHNTRTHATLNECEYESKFGVNNTTYDARIWHHKHHIIEYELRARFVNFLFDRCYRCHRRHHYFR